jgi:hypothetical protein
LVNQMVKAQWQLARAERLETVAFDLLALPAPDSGNPDIRIVNATSGRDALGMFKRYAVQAERSYYKAYREFAAAKKIQNEAKLVATLDASLAASFPPRSPIAQPTEALTATPKRAPYKTNPIRPPQPPQPQRRPPSPQPPRPRQQLRPSPPSAPSTPKIWPSASSTGIPACVRLT